MKIKIPFFRKEQKVFRNSMCLDTSIAILKCAGVWMPDVKHPWNLVYAGFGVIFQIITFYLIVISEIGYVFMVMGDTNRAIEAAVLLLSHLVQGVKMMNVVLRQERIKNLIRFMDGPNFNTPDPETQVMVADTIKLAALAGDAMTSSAGITAILWCCAPVLKTEISLPLKTAYPFDWTKNPMFGILYAYTSISVTTVGVSDGAVNFLVSGMMVMSAVQLDVLSRRLDKLGNQQHDGSYEEVVSCIKLHQNIIKYVDELEAIFGTAILCQFITSSVIVCMTLFKITITTEPLELVSMIFYMICVFMELMMYCYPGDLIINKSLQVAEAAFPSNWSGNLRCRRALLLTALRAQKELVVNAGGVFRVSLPTAAAVVRSAYSYYAVLSQKMNEKEFGKIE